MLLPGQRLSSQDALIARFNRACAWFALAWLGILLPASLLVRPTYQDLSGIYIGALVARLGAWNVLYPVPSGDTRFYVGEKGQSEQKPGLVQIAQDHGVDELNPYLNPPWQAMVLLPLGWLTFGQAHWVLVGVNVFCAWRVAVAAGRGYELAAGRPSYAAGWVTLLVACSLLTYRSIRVQNLSPVVAFCIAVAVADMMGSLGRSGLLGGLAMALGALIKLATLPLVPLALAMRRWRMLGWTAGLGVLVVLVTWDLAGTSVFREFFGSIAPSLGHSSLNLGNKSLQGFLLRITGQSPLPRALGVGLEVVRWGSLAVILALLARRFAVRGVAMIPAYILAAASALLCWLLIFTPLCWEHYFMYLCPFWGWLVWEAGQSRVRRIVVIAAIAAQWFPLPTLTWLTVREPFNSYMLGGAILMLGVAVVRLKEKRLEGNV